MWLKKLFQKKEAATPNQAKRKEFDQFHETTMDLGKQLRERRSKLDSILDEINKNAQSH